MPLFLINDVEFEFFASSPRSQYVDWLNLCRQRRETHTFNWVIIRLFDGLFYEMRKLLKSSGGYKVLINIDAHNGLLF